MLLRQFFAVLSSVVSRPLRILLTFSVLALLVRHSVVHWHYWSVWFDKLYQGSKIGVVFIFQA